MELRVVVVATADTTADTTAENCCHPLMERHNPLG